MRLINADALEKALETENIRIAAEKGKMFRLIETAPTVEILILSCFIDMKTGVPGMVLEIGGEKHELHGPPVDLKELDHKLGMRESDCGPGCARYPRCEHNHGRHGIVRINCPLWRAKG